MFGSVRLYVCLSFCPSVCLCVCLSFCLSVCLSVCLSGCLSVCLSAVCLSGCPSVCLSACQSCCLLVCRSVRLLFYSFCLSFCWCCARTAAFSLVALGNLTLRILVLKMFAKLGMLVIKDPLCRNIKDDATLQLFLNAVCAWCTCDKEIPFPF